MHHHAEVVLPPPKPGQEKRSIRERICNTLRWHRFMPNLGFDWCVVGGRWSGTKAAAKLDQEKLGAFWKEFKKRGYEWVSKEISAEQRRKQSNELFMEFFPDYKGAIPVYRDAYKDDGYEDDICPIVDVPELLSCYALAIPQTHELLVIDEYDHKESKFKKTDFDGFVRKELVKRKITEGTVVTIDYHT